MNKIFSAAVAVLLFVSLSGCGGKELMEHRLTGAALGTTYSVKYLDVTESVGSAQLDSVFNAVNASMSTYIPNSDISRINRGESGVRVDEMFEEVFSTAQRISLETEGWFDPTIGILVNAWGFGPGEKQDLDSTKVAQLLQSVGMDKVSLSNGVVRKSSPEVYIDFNALAKGYTLDRVAALFDQKKVGDFMIEIGGEIIARGQNIDGKPWRIGIEKPDEAEMGRALYAVVSLENKAMATSGNYRKYHVDENGRKVVHTINPHTGWAQANNLLSTSVLANTCMEADAYATAFLAMGYQRTLAFMEKHPELEVYLIYSDKYGNISTYSSAGFEKLMLK